MIDFDDLKEEGLLQEEEYASLSWGDQPTTVDYGLLYGHKFTVLKTACSRISGALSEQFQKFCKEQKFWLDDYALYMSIKNFYDGKSWIEWDKDIRERNEESLLIYENKLREEVEFYKYLQYLFYQQWHKLKAYANKKGISIIGDIPIYVSLDSADTWANPELFQLNKECLPKAVAGCPPDSFCETGQLWGNPLYDWEYHKFTDYKWWIQRIESSFDLYDIVRIDHFRGFDEYYSIPYGDKTAINGTWEKGPGMELFKYVKDALGEVDIIAEDLGFLTDSVKKLLDDTGYPGMKILQFAFDSREDSDYLPHNYNRNCVVYTGTHDNNTIYGWYKEINKEDKRMSINYMNNKYTRDNAIHWDFICLAMRSVADTCIIPVQDYLGLGKEARINVPSTLGTNWTWRMSKKGFSKKMVKKIKMLTKLYGRM